jgi:two-component system cell cycle response regulator
MSKKVLTIDDSKTLRTIVARYLKPFGVEISEAENGSVGLTKAQSDKPDLILLDYNMPVMDGYQTLEALKADAALKHIPVIMLTTETIKETVVKLIKLGLKDFIAKPFSREALLSKVNPVLGLYAGEVVPDVANLEPGSQGTAGPAKTSLLAVDDKENVLKLLKDMLEGSLNVVTAPGGQTAISMIPTLNFEWLLLDIDMPDMNGVEVYKQMKPVLDSKHVKVAGMVLRTAQQDLASARQAGIKDFLYKPFTKADINVLFASWGLKCGADGTAGIRKGFLTSEGNIKVLSFPQESDPELKVFANSLVSEIPNELKAMADEGGNQLIVELSSAVLADFNMVKRFLGLIDLIESLTISMKLVASHEKTRERLAQFSETAKMQTFNSLAEALKSFS